MIKLGSKLANVKSAIRGFLLLLGVCMTAMAMAADELTVQNVTDNVYAIVGSMGNRSPENLGNNATFGFVTTAQGVVLIDSGGSYQGARHLAALIKRVTDKPVVKVINTGGQDHRWLGNGYFKQHGAEIIASEAAIQDQLFMLGNLVGVKGLQGTDPVYANHTFDKQLQFELGGTRFEIYHAGAAHTPGDSYVWLPKQQVMFSGDIVFTERMLGILDHSNSKSWVTVFQRMASYHPKYLVPGHGHPTTLAKATADTYDYLVFVRQAVAKFMKAGGDISDVGKIDQSKFNYLTNFDTLAGRNAQRVYSELEWE
jgi:glyoxylase-like metal-dependent hydrolase (beta-lactamase superfamily II)